MPVNAAMVNAAMVNAAMVNAAMVNAAMVNAAMVNAAMVNAAMVWQVAAALAVTALSGWLYRRGSGLRPIAAATWLAPVPLLVLAPRVSWPLAAGAAAGAWLVGQSGLWSFLTRQVRLPRPLVAAQIAGSCFLVASVVLLVRAQLTTGQLALAALAFPAGWVTMEFLVAIRSPHGAWWSLAYSQADQRVVIQVAALTGVWGVSALLGLPAGVAAAVLAPTGTTEERLAVFLAGVAVGAVILWYATRRADRIAPGDPVHKRHLVPGLGHDLYFLLDGGRHFPPDGGPSPSDAGGRLGVLICKDLDFPGLVRAYRRSGARMLLAPAWDFVRDDWLHSRMAVLRGVESGVAVARVARGGRATVSDAYGRILAEAEVAGGTTVDTVVPLGAVTTGYRRLGDWSAWSCLAATALIVVLPRL